MMEYQAAMGAVLRQLTRCQISLIVLASITVPAQAADDLRRPIRASSDGHFLVRPDGKPFFYLGENVEYLLWRLNREDTDLYLRDRAAKGFTVVVGHVVPRTNMNEPNAYGERAFLGGNIAHPNPRYFEHVDWVIRQAGKYGLRVGLAPINGIEYVAQGKFTAQNARIFGQWLGNRYRTNSGIVWVLGWDATPIWSAKPLGTPPSKVVLKDFRPVYDAFVAGLRQGYRSNDIFITYHPDCCSFEGTPEPRTSLYLGSRTWLDMNMLQSSHFKDPSAFLKLGGFAFGWDSTLNYEPIRKEYDSVPVRPVIDGEPQYENIPRNLDPKIRSGRWDEVDVRNSAYHAVFAGAAGHDYNHLSVVDFYLPNDNYFSSDSAYNPTIPWKEALNAPGAREIHHIKDLMLSRPYFTRIPDQTIIVGDTGEGSSHISGTRDRSGSYMMAYLPEGQDVTINMAKLAATSANAWWFNPRTGRSTPIARHFATNQSSRFTPPSRGRGNDWVLVLDDASKGFPPPGTAPR
jgi:hypothetical protein